MEKHILSKSTFIKGHQCLKSLYLHKKRPFLRDKLSAEQLAKFKRGHKVGEMAQQLFTGGIDVSPKSPSQYQKSVIHTQELIAEGQKIIYEATFQFNKVLIMLDILVKTEKGWEAYEAKSSRKLSETYFTDAALQYYVITQSGLDLASFSLIYVNENYIQLTENEIDLQSYFIKQDVSTEVKNMQSQIANEIENELQILTESHSPKIEVGAHCLNPYKCDFIGFCWKSKSTDLFKIPALNETERTEMLNKGILSLDELKTQNPSNPLVEKQIDSLILNKPFVSDNLKSILSTLPNNTIYFGFLARQSAIPRCAGTKPYQNQLLAYSVVSAEINVKYLFSGTCIDYQDFVESLIKLLSTSPQIIVFDKEYLASILEDISRLFPQLSIDIEQINQKTFGLKQWILEGQFYFPGFKYDLLFKDVVWKALNINAFAKQALYSDILAINMYEQMLENSTLFDDNNEDAKALLSYVENIVKYTQLMAEALGQ